jgi:pullulanase
MKKTYLILLLFIEMLISCNTTQKYASYADYPIYEGSDLELTYSAQTSKFRVWAPTADKVKLLLYDNGYEGGAYKTLDMDRSEKGTWTLKINENLKGKFYTFQIKIGEKWLEETPGMWVKATGINGKRAAIIDFTETNPSGWENDTRPPLKNYTDIMLYEVHMRDFSMDSNSGIKHKGKYLAFTERGTKNSFGDATGIDHLKELGITHVHLLPVFDFASVDETKLNENKYNWGYDPVNYNVPEGSYSTNPTNPVTRILEFKEMVQSLHKSGIRVIMDVVYNHTSKGKGSNLDLLAPGYFYRQNADSTWSNASGCGNETASERAMMRKFMIESVVYWATEYHIDGFRFDLMGIHDIETMNSIRAALNNIDPTIFMYGEGWTAAASPLAEDKRAIKKNAKELDNIAVFSDDIRDALKGSWMHSQIPGFVSGIDSLEESVKFGIVGATQHADIDYSKLIYSKAPYVNNPTQIINYVSCHDDMCLVDKLKESKPLNATDEELVRFNKLAQTVVFTSQGVPFMYAGEELYRTKKGIHNTYQSPDSINRIDWNSKNSQKDIFNYYKGLIALRKAHPAFRMPTQEMLEQHLKFIYTKIPNVIAFMLTDHVNDDAWKDILVIYNGNRKMVSVPIPSGEWNLVCHDGQINLNGMAVINNTTFMVEPSSASILYMKN